MLLSRWCVATRLVRSKNASSSRSTGYRRQYSQTATPSSHAVKSIGVVGAGQMGTGIAKVAITQAKLPVLLMDNNTGQLDKALQLIDSLFAKDVAKEKITKKDAEAARARLTVVSSLTDLEDADFVIEAAIENPELKYSVFAKLDEIVKKDSILASNTSSISISKISTHTKRPDKVIGMHFMNPVPAMKLVEVIPGIATSEATRTTTLALAHQMEKVTTTSKDFAGFIANRLLCPYLNDAFEALREGLGTAEDIDTTMKLGCNMPMGPLTLADFIGLDTVCSIMRVMQAELGDRYRPSPLLLRYVEAGRLGKKVGRGVFEYPNPHHKA